jgi:hypothetical protein
LILTLTLLEAAATKLADEGAPELEGANGTSATKQRGERQRERIPPPDAQRHLTMFDLQSTFALKPLLIFLFIDSSFSVSCCKLPPSTF